MKGGFLSNTGLSITCPSCGKRQRVSRKNHGKVQCGHCLQKIELPAETVEAAEPELDPSKMVERIQALEKLMGRVEALEVEVARLKGTGVAAPIALSEEGKKREKMTFAARLERCRPGKLAIHFAQNQARASEHATQVCQLFKVHQWEVHGPTPSASGRAGTTFAVGALPMTPALADLFLALDASGVEVVSVLDQNLASDEARLTITNDTAQMMPGKGKSDDAAEAA